jgi:integrase
MIKISDSDLADQTSIKKWIKKNKFQLQINKPKKITIGKGLYIYCSLNTDNDVNYKFVWRKMINGKQKDTTLKARTYSLAVAECEMQIQQNKNGDGFLSFTTVWNEYIKTDKYKVLAANSQRVYRNLFNKYLSDNNTLVIVKNPNLCRFSDFEYAREVMMDILKNDEGKTTKTIITRAVMILDKLFVVMRSNWNINITLNTELLTKQLLETIPKHEVKHYKAMSDKVGDEKELEKNLIHLFIAMEKAKIKKLPRLFIEFKLYSILRGAEVALIEERDIHTDDDIPNVHIRHTKTIKEEQDGFYVPLTDTMMEQIKQAKQLKGKSVFLNNADHNSMLGYWLEKINENLEKHERLTAHGFRTLARTYFNFHENEVSSSTAENCLSHKVGDTVVQSYNRNQFAMSKRVKAMQLWSQFLDECRKKAEQIFNNNSEKGSDK